MAVEQSDDGGSTWGPSWAMSEDDHDRLNRQYSALDGRYSMGLGVQARKGGHVVVVANGLDGILVRDVSGAWRRVGWPGTVEEPTVDLAPERNVALCLAACMLFGGIAMRLRRYQRVYTGFAVAACLGLFTALSVGADPISDQGMILPHLDLGGEVGLTLLGVFVTVVGTVVCLVLAFAGRTRPVTAAVSVGAAPLIFAAVYTPFLGWANGVPGAYSGAVVCSVLLTALVVVVSGVLIRIDAPPAHDSGYLDGSSTSSPT
jgi:hypothetical protein